MATQTMFEGTTDAIGDPVEITGDFDLQVIGDLEGGIIRIARALGPIGDTNQVFKGIEETSIPDTFFIKNVGTNRFRVRLIGTTGSGTKKVIYNQA